MLSSLSYAILAMLAEKPQSGYDLSRHMKPPLGYVWQAKHGQIYPELARLEDSGLVRVRRDDKGMGPPRRVHSITRAGKAELTRWVTATPHVRPMNDELVVKAFAMGGSNGAASGALLQEQIRLHEHRLAALEQRSEALSTRRRGADEFQLGDYAALRRAIGIERELIAWCRWLVAELERGAKSTRRTATKRDSSAKRSLAARSRRVRRT